MSTSKTKKALIGSAGALVLCFALLLGTTFAWFTDNATTNVNKIQAGKLDVSLEMKTDDGWVDAEGKTLSFIDMDENDLWEPGCTYYADDLRITNKGDLALKFKVKVTGLDGGAKLNKAIEWGLLSARDNNGADAADYPYIWSWKDVDGEESYSPIDGEFALLPGESVYMQLIAEMDKAAGNKYQGLSIDGISITVMATQYTYESDSVSNQYDAGAAYAASITDSASIDAVINSGAGNIMVDGSTVVDVPDDGWTALYFCKEKHPGMADKIVLDGNGSVKSNKFVIWGRTGADITIKGGTYETTGTSHLIYVNEGGKVTIEGGKFIAPAGAGCEQMFNMANTAKGGQIVIKGGLYSRDPSTQIAGNDVWNGTTGVKIEDGYKVVEKNIDGTTWYEVVPE